MIFKLKIGLGVTGLSMIKNCLLILASFLLLQFLIVSLKYTNIIYKHSYIKFIKSHENIRQTHMRGSAINCDFWRT